MDFEAEVRKPLPIWWMAGVEVALLAAAVWFIFDGKYLEAISIAVLVEIRDISWQVKRRNVS